MYYVAWIYVRDAIHVVVVGTLIGLLPSSILMIEGSRVDTEIAT
jgi:hypothetical protein